MNAHSVTPLETRLRRVERQNRILIALFCVAAGLALLGAAKGGANVLSIDELRTHRISLVDKNGLVVHSWWATPGTMNE